MLKRLELIGFKSFADKTQFDFPAGITAIVGPNGSGKSNIVDAVRWTLGEQSAKSLRGGEMADVIFNGSTSRRSLGMAEVSLTFDNGQRSLAADADEVCITRRVYRNGEGEYLINHQPCRLRDIKDLFLGTGAGTDAYSIIEQGKVDVLLQASTRERRTIFEEAAGISRFKAKKIETLRKLERVELNLERLKDIVEEVDKQLRSVKLQASRARRYQEYANRLREVRIALGLREYHEFTIRLAEQTEVLTRLRDELDLRSTQIKEWEQSALTLETTIAQLDDDLRAAEADRGAAVQRMTSAETTISHEHSQLEDLEADLVKTQVQVNELAQRVTMLESDVRRIQDEMSRVESQHHEQAERVMSLESELQVTVEKLTEIQTQTQADKAAHLDRMHQAARFHNDTVSSQAKLDHLQAERNRLRHRTDEAVVHLNTLDLELRELTRAAESLQLQLTANRRNLSDQRQERDRLQRLADEQAHVLAETKVQQSALVSRMEILERLEQTFEGLGSGVRELAAIVERDRQSGRDTWHSLVGLTADFLTVRHEFAPLIDIALGERSQQFLVRNPVQLFESLRKLEPPLSGRVTFLPIQTCPATSECNSGQGSEAGSLPNGVIQRAVDLVDCDHAEWRELPRQLLGNVLIVKDLESAWEVKNGGFACRCVTLQGELLEPDGTLTVGTHGAESGLISRKSELREIRQRLVLLEERVASGERNLLGLRDHVADIDRHATGLQTEIDVLAEQTADLRSRISQRRERQDGLTEEVSVTQTELQRIDADVLRASEALSNARRLAEDADREIELLQARLTANDQELRDRDHQRQQRQQEVTAAKVTLATIVERLTGLRTQHGQVMVDLGERRRQAEENENSIHAIRKKEEDCRRKIEEANEVVSESTVKRDLAEGRIAQIGSNRNRLREEKQKLASQLNAVGAEWRTTQEKAHAIELVVSDFRHERDALADRLRTDYQVELSELHRPEIELAEFDSALAQEELDDLRQKLTRLGGVNLDSLQELAELEARSQSLQTQFDDLTSAKRSLEEIIDTINVDSRRLFGETFEAIRGHFQEMFRKLFGGGMADIILENENDILESGIEIIARPPGKELRSISLMSGGEKTLTAVAILLAIFRSKPSPFCILDEVDAAPDEANIGRFTTVLRDFLDRSQFIIVTHSKKTMAVADVLYGITMQESGISKQVAVRFEDWVEDGSHHATTGLNGAGARQPVAAGLSIH